MVIGKKQLSKDDLSSDYHDDETTQSWRYKRVSDGLHSTQQLEVDWSRFEEHTFFHSAEVKVNAAYERIVNHFPYDGDQKEKQAFFDALNGFENYVYGLFPKYIGYMKFDGNSKVVTQDSQGYLFPQLARKATLQSVLGSGVKKNGFTCEFFFAPPDDNTAHSNQVIFQKLSTDGTTGISLIVTQSAAADKDVFVHGIFTSGSGDAAGTRDTYKLHLSASVPKGKFSHLAFVYDKSGTSSLKILRNGRPVASSSSTLLYEKLDFTRSDITIGSGSHHVGKIISNAVNSKVIEAQQFLTGALDEFRFWTEARTDNQISASMHYNAISTENLGLYYKFNEPTGSYANNNIILDSSGNGLHSTITNYSLNQRKLELTPPAKYESSKENPVLFPDYPTLTSQNVKLLASASNYDFINPNYILRLIPSHYLEGDNVQPQNPTLLPEYTSSIAMPGGGQMPSNQVIAHFLFLWAAFFDDIKLYIDSFSDIASLNYEDINGIPQNAIQMVARQYNFTLPNVFSEATPEQFHLGRKLNDDIIHSDKSLKSILNSIWRRVTSELPHVVRSKGTHASIRMMLNSFGIDADSNFRIREYGGHPMPKTLNSIRKDKKKTVKVLNITTESMRTHSANLQAYRWEPGKPAINFALPVFNPATRVWSPQTKLLNLTSGSFTFESQYILNQQSSFATQSLMRMDLSASDGSTSPYINVLVYSGSTFAPENYSVRMVVANSGSSAAFASDVTIPNINMFDGSRWYVSVSRNNEGPRSEMVLNLKSANKTRIYAEYTTSSFIQNVVQHPFDAYAKTSTAGSVPGADNRTADIPFITIGEYNGYSAKHLNNNANKSFGTHITKLKSKVFGFRFWSKNLTEKEKDDHALNPFSFGSADPITNSPYATSEFPALGITTSLNFVPTMFDPKNNMINLLSGSWERLRLFVDNINNATGSDANGRLTMDDLSQNNYHFNVFGAPSSQNIMANETIDYSIYDPNWDSPSISNKIRVRSFLEAENAEKENAVLGRLTKLDPSEKTSDDKRFSIEASVAQAINEDIANAISDIFFMENAIGAPEMLYAMNYPDLQKLADKYFNRLENKVDFKNYFEFFKWFDANFADMIAKLVPNTTEFLGVNFVIESHMLERHKLQYLQADVHIDLSRRLAARVQRFANAAVSNPN